MKKVPVWQAKVQTPDCPVILAFWFDHLPTKADIRAAMRDNKRFYEWEWKAFDAFLDAVPDPAPPVLPPPTHCGVEHVAEASDGDNAGVHRLEICVLYMIVRD